MAKYLKKSKKCKIHSSGSFLGSLGRFSVFKIIQNRFFLEFTTVGPSRFSGSFFGIQKRFTHSALRASLAPLLPKNSISCQGKKGLELFMHTLLFTCFKFRRFTSPRIFFFLFCIKLNFAQMYLK